MTLATAQTTLDNLKSYLNRSEPVVQALVDSHSYAKASDEYAKLITHGYRELNLCAQEVLAPEANFASAKELNAPDLRAKLTNELSDISTRLKALDDKRTSCDKEYLNNKQIEEAKALEARNQEIKEKGQIQMAYVNAYKSLKSLTNQKEPKNAVEENLNIFLGQVRKFQGSISTEELTNVMQTSYDYLTGGSHDKFTSMLNKLNYRDSIPLKLLGATLIALGVTLIAAAFVFAPAIITASAAGVGLVYASAAATAVSSAALIGFGGSLFNKQTERMKLASALKPLDEKNLEEAHYAPALSPSV